VIVCEPEPAIEGLNSPVAAFVIPVPTQLPPAVTAVIISAVLVKQKGPAGLTVGSSIILTIISSVSTPPQAPVIV